MYEINGLRSEVKKLRNELNNLNSFKEHLFQEKDRLTGEILSLISEVKKLKQRRDSLTKQVKEEKENRKKIDDEIAVKIKEVKELNKEKKKIIDKYNIKVDPSRINDEIERLELKIQTEPMSFDKEKKIMETINKLKKQKKQAEEVSNVWGKTNIISMEIDELKKKREVLHEKIQNWASESQKSHEQMIEVSKNIDSLKEKEKEKMEKFLREKEKFVSANNLLKEKLQKLAELQGTIEKERKKRYEEKEQKEKEFIESKEKEIEEKMKMKKKITTEDLLFFQKGK